MENKINVTNDEIAEDIAMHLYKSVYNQKEKDEIDVWNNNKYYNGDGIYRLPKLDTVEEKIEFIKQFSGNLTAMAWLNYINSLDLTIELNNC